MLSHAVTAPPEPDDNGLPNAAGGRCAVFQSCTGPGLPSKRAGQVYAWVPVTVRITACAHATGSSM